MWIKKKKKINNFGLKGQIEKKKNNFTKKLKVETTKKNEHQI